MFQRILFFIRTYPRRPNRSSLLVHFYNLWDEKISVGGQTLVLLFFLSILVEFLPGLTWAAGFAIIAILALVVSFFISLRSQSPLQVSGFYPSQGIESKTIKIQFRVSNPTDRNASGIGIRFFRLTDGLFSKTTSEFQTIERNSSCYFELELELKQRGTYQFNHIYLLQVDPLGLFYKRRRVEIDWTLNVLPQSRSHPKAHWHMSEFSKRYHKNHLIGIHSQNTFKGLRPFQKGDSKKSIHQKTWAKLNQPMVKDFHYQHPLPKIRIYLDPYIQSVWDKLSFEICLQYLMNFQQNLLRQNVELCMNLITEQADTNIKTGFQKDLHLFHNLLCSTKPQKTSRPLDPQNFIHADSDLCVVFTTREFKLVETHESTIWIRVGDQLPTFEFAPNHYQFGSEGGVVS